MSTPTTANDVTQPDAQLVAQPDAGTPGPGAQPDAPQGPGAQPAGPTPGVNGVRTPMQNAVDNTVQPPAPTAAEQKAVTLATKSPNPVAQHLHDVAETLSGGGRYTTTYDDSGNPTRHKVPVSTAHLGLALAMEVLRGGLAGISGDPREAAKRGMDEGKAQVAAQQKAQQDQNNRDSADQARKQSITEANLKLHQAAMNVGKADEETNRQMDATFAPVMNDLERNHPEAILDKVPEWALADALKKYNITKEMAIPYDTIPVLDQKTGQQAKHADGSPVWGHMYAIVDPSIKTTLSDETQTMGYNVGEFRDANGNKAQIGTPSNWPLKDIISRHTKYAQIQVAEGLLNKQIAQLKGMDAGAKEGPQMNLADQVRSDPSLMSAVEDYSKYAGVGDLDQVLYTMGQSKDPSERQSAARIMQLSGVTSDELEAKHNERVEAAAEAAKPKQATPETPEKAALTKQQTLEAAAGTAQKTAAAAKDNAEAAKIRNEALIGVALDTSHDRYDANGLNVGYLEALPVNARALVSSITSGHMPPERLSYLLRGKDGQQLLEMVSHADPNFDAAKAASYGETYKQFTSTRKGTAGGALNAGGTALGHLNELMALNTVASHVPHTPAWTAYQNKVDTVSTELATFYGDTTIPAIAAIKDTLSSTLPGNRESAIRTQAQSMGDKLDAYEQQWQNAAPSKYYEAPMPNITNVAKAARAKLDPDGYGKRYAQEHAPESQKRPGEIPVLAPDGTTIIGFTMPGKTGYRPVKQ